MKHNKFLVLLLGAAISFSSCKKVLELSPTDTFNESNAFQTIEDLKAGVNGAYARYSAYANNMYTSALTSDEAKLGSGNSGQGGLTYRYQYASDPTSGGDVTSAYGAYFSLIDQVNRVLPKVPTVSATAAQEPLRGSLKGQLLALRAIAYYELLNNYSNVYNPADPLGVPLVLVSDINAQPARNSMGEVMAQIDADLAEAKTLVAADAFSDVTLNKVNIAAFQARIALYKKDYDGAIAFATEVINSGIKPLVSGSAFSGIWIDLNTNETLFRIVYTGSGIGSLWTTTGGNIYIAPSDKLVASYGTGDIRKAAYIGGTAGDYYVNKFYTSARGGRIVDLKAARISEIYLIRAEAYAKKASPDLTAGAADLNAVRAARITGYVNETFATAAALVTAVLDERFKELAFEGFRFYDLKRNGLPVQRLASDANIAWQTLPAGDYRFVYPIPSTELTANRNMVQNPFY